MTRRIFAFTAAAMLMASALAMACGFSLAATETTPPVTVVPTVPQNPAVPKAPATPAIQPPAVQDPAAKAPAVPVPGAAPALEAPAAAAPAPSGPAATDAVSGDKTLPQVFYGEEGLPQPVRDLRRRLIAAARTGDLEALRPIFQAAPEPPELSGGDSDDPIATLKLLSGDDKGREILAILLDVLESGYARVDVGTPQEAYVWPYFARYPLDKLSGPQMVELFRLITAGDFQDMQEKGVYSFYRLTIGPNGQWQSFEDGD